jgi:dihydrofolate reductase
MTQLSIIAAIATNYAIGRDNNLLWKLKDDMQLFVKATSGHAVIMGRKTFESLNGPLPRRQNIVVTRSLDYRAEGVEIAHSIEKAIDLVQGETAFVIGGGHVYRECMEHADFLYISHVEDDVADADTFFPTIDKTVWVKEEETHYGADARNEKAFTFCKYKRV